jgi:hypothetical protein
MKALFAAVITVVSLAGVATAATVDAEDILKQFTVVALGNHTSTSHMVGSVYVGGDFTAAQSGASRTRRSPTRTAR